MANQNRVCYIRRISMIEYLSKKTAQYLAKDCDTADEEVLAYGYYLLYQEWIVRLTAILLALPFGLALHVLVSIIAFNLIRRCAMGAHAKYPIVCRIITFIVWFGPAILAVFFMLRLTLIAYIGLYIFSAVLLFIYAPAETDIKKVPDLQKRKTLKREAIGWLSGIFLVAFAINGIYPEIATVMVITAAMACCMVHPWMYWLNGFDPVTRELRG